MPRVRLLLPLLLLAATPLRAAVTITFWSHDFGQEFPHAFFTLRGRPVAGGASVDANYGFTAARATPAILLGPVPGRLDSEARPYLQRSDAHFSVTLDDRQYAAIVQLIAAWDPRSGDGHYDLNTRNCVHFVAEAARRIGLVGLDQPRLMKKPKSFLRAVEAANAGRVTPVDLTGRAYLAQVDAAGPPQ